VFIHDALEELITCGDTSISSSNLRTYIRKMHKIIPEKAISGFTDQFRLLKKVSRLPIDSDLSDALEPYNKEKNRYPSRIPYNMNRARLRPTGVSGAEYINASFLDGYKQRNAYIATQAPLRNTVNDFWRMMWEFKSRAIVMLCQLTENEQEVSYQYWPTQQGAKQMCGKNSVTLVSEEEMSEAPEVKIRKFEITDDKNTSTFTITQYQVTTWPEQGRVSPQLLIKLITHLTKLQRSTENKPITVMCNDGMGRTGTFVCIHAMLERMNTEGVVDFFQFIKFSRISRPDIVREQEHYILCHDTLADYLDSFDTYANFKA
jgi:protein tyrosine phosphatase